MKQQLENEFRCLSVADVELEFPDIVVVKTKAAVVDQSIEM